MKTRGLSLILMTLLIAGCSDTAANSCRVSEDLSANVTTNNPITSQAGTTNNPTSNNQGNNSSVGSYYASLDLNLNGNDFLLALDQLLDRTSAPSSKFSYNGSNNGMQTVFPYTDADPNNTGSGKILSFYSGTPATWSAMNREHVWPDSRGGNHTEIDPHVIRPTLTSENSARGNSFFNESPTSWDPATFSNAKYRGIAARIVFYAAVRYQDSGLKMSDATSDATANKSMGKLSTLLKWNLQYSIDATETLRNNVLVNKYSHCRNPFIDNPSFACKIWGNTNANTKAACGM